MVTLIQMYSHHVEKKNSGHKIISSSKKKKKLHSSIKSSKNKMHQG